MTDYMKYINALRKCAKEHENDRTSFGHIIVSDMCRDTANLLEELEQITDLKDAYDKGYKDGQEALAFHLELCKGEQQPCEDCISRAEALKNLALTNSKDDVYRMINSLSSVQPKPKTGHWVEENINEWSRKVFCSECGCPPPFEYVNTGDVYSASGYGVINKTKYCPNCGAKMESEE